jgi:hypothetical protein
VAREGAQRRDEAGEEVIRCPHCHHSLMEDLAGLWGLFMYTRRLSDRRGSRFAKMNAEEKSEAGRDMALARWRNK